MYIQPPCRQPASRRELRVVRRGGRHGRRLRERRARSCRSGIETGMLDGNRRVFVLVEADDRGHRERGVEVSAVAGAVASGGRASDTFTPDAVGGVESVGAALDPARGEHRRERLAAVVVRSGDRYVKASS